MVDFEDALKGYHRDFVEADADGPEKYKPIVPPAVVSAIFGVLSILTILGWGMVVFPLTGLLCGVFALRKILASPEDVGGFQLAVAGIVLSLVFWLVGYSYLAYSYYYEIPFGYVPITFEEIAGDPKTGKLPQRILDLAWDPERTDMLPQKVFIEGEMYPGKHLHDIDQFIIVETIAQSRFSSMVREPTESVLIHITGGRTVSHRTGKVRVGGVLTVDKSPPPGETPYRIDADVFR